MAIPEQFLDELTARCDIADVVADYVPLTRKGNNLWGLCPFHGEKTPSFPAFRVSFPVNNNSIQNRTFRKAILLHTP